MENGWRYIRGFCRPEVNHKAIFKSLLPYVVLDRPLLFYSKQTYGDMVDTIKLLNETTIHELVHYLGEVQDESPVEWAVLRVLNFI